MPVEGPKDVLDHRRVFDARNYFDRAAAVRARCDVKLEHPHQPLRPRHPDMVPGCRLVSGRCLATPAPRRRHLFTQPVVRRKDAVATTLAAREVLDSFDGEANVAGYTVLCGRSQTPRGMALLDTPNGQRLLATSDHACLIPG